MTSNLIISIMVVLNTVDTSFPEVDKFSLSNFFEMKHSTKYRITHFIQNLGCNFENWMLVFNYTISKFKFSSKKKIQYFSFLFIT